MPFVPRTAEEILNDFVNYLTINTKLTDFNVGSVIRTMLEAVAMEDATQYTQMINVLNSFYIGTASGDELEDRAAQYDLVRKQATPSNGTAYFLDTSLEKAFLTQDLVSGVTVSVPVDDASVFPTPPFTARLGEGTGNQEDVTVNAVDTVTNILTLAAAVLFKHKAAGSFIDSVDNRSNLVCFVSGLPDRTIPAGVTLQTKGTNVNISINAYTSEDAIHPNGNFVSNSVGVTTKLFGSASVVPPKVLSRITGSPPFFGAAVINLSSITGGADVESDSELQARVVDHIGGLSAGTVSAISAAILNPDNFNDSERITKVNIFEDFENKVTLAYANTGEENFIGDKDLAITDTLSAAIAAPVLNLSINNVLDFPDATSGSLQWLIIDPSNTNGKMKVMRYLELISTGVVSDFNLATFPGGFPVPANTVVVVPEVIVERTEFNKKYYNLINFPLTNDNILLHLVDYNNATFDLDDGSIIKLLVKDVDYILNEATGQIEFLKGKIPLADRAILATYNTFTGVIKSAQSAIDGDLSDPLSTPGIRSAGVKVRVLPALREVIDFVVDVTYESQVTNIETLQFLTDQAIRSYVTGLPIGGDIILAEIIDRIMDIIGVINVHIKSPSDDVAILHDHYATIGTVTVS